MTRTELIIQRLKVAIGLAFGAYFVWWSLEVLDRLTPEYDAPTALVGRIFKANAAPVEASWMWTPTFEHHEDRTPTRGHAATRDAAMAALAEALAGMNSNDVRFRGGAGLGRPIVPIISDATDPTGHRPGRNPALHRPLSPPVQSACAFTSMRRSHDAVRSEADDVARSIPIDVGQLARVGGVAAPTGIGTKDREL